MERTEQGEFCWIDLSAADLEAQTAFYERLFGWGHSDSPTDDGRVYRTFTLYDMVVAGAITMSDDMREGGMPSMWIPYILAKDVEDISSRAQSLGAQIGFPAMDVSDQGRILGVLEPSGAPTFFWQPKLHLGSRIFMRPGSLIWCDLNTREPEKALGFFRELLGWEFHENPPGAGVYWGISVAGREEGGVMRMGEQFAPDVPPHWLSYFGARDVEQTVALAEELGGRAIIEPVEVPGLISFCVLSDPAGATFAIMQPLEKPAEETAPPAES